jgi:hypothetical protein
MVTIMSDGQLVLAVSALIILFGAFLLYFYNHLTYIRKYLLQIVGLLFILPVIMVLSSLKCIDSETVTVIISSIVGYLFGRTAADQKEIEQAMGSVEAFRQTESEREATPWPSADSASDSHTRDHQHSPDAPSGPDSGTDLDTRL